ncbi:MAG: hypothetical protein ACYC8T_10670 [Myxococcaceae bacterium]
MNESFEFSLVKRLGGVRYPLAVITLVAVLLAVFRPPLSSWKLWGGLLAISLMAVRVLQFLFEARGPVILSDVGVTRSGRTVPFHSAQLELKVMGRSGGPRVEEVVLWTPRSEGDGRLGVGFDHSLEGFERAVLAVVSRVPEMRIVVSALDSADVRDERREAVLEKFRPAEPAPVELTAAQKALEAIGRPLLGAPPPGKKN